MGRAIIGTVLVTGAARRIGRSVAEALAADGWAVALHCNASAEAAEAVAAGIRGRGGRAAVLACDLLDGAAVGRLVERAAAALGPVTALVNNASLFELDGWDDFTLDGWRRHMDVNLTAPALLARDMARGLPDGADGCIVNLIDQKVWNLNPDYFSYTVSKLGLEGFTRYFARVMFPRVRVCGIAPGLTLPSGSQTGEQFQRIHDRAPLGRGSTPADIVGAVRFVLATAGLTGETLIVDGGQHLRRSPRDVMFLAGRGERG